MTRDQAVGIVVDAAERRARVLLNEASRFERSGQTALANETMREHYKPLREAINMVRGTTDIVRPGT